MTQEQLRHVLDVLSDSAVRVHLTSGAALAGHNLHLFVGENTGLVVLYIDDNTAALIASDHIVAVEQMPPRSDARPVKPAEKPDASSGSHG